MKFESSKAAGRMTLIVTLLIGGVSLAGSPSMAVSATGSTNDLAYDAALSLRDVRTVDLRSEQMPAELTRKLPSDEPVVDEGVVPLPPGVRLDVGESVLVNYEDGVVVFEQVALACTTSSSASTPKFVVTPKTLGHTSSAHSYGQSAGCVGKADIRFMQEQGSTPKGAQQYAVAPGTTVSKTITVTCTSKPSKSWKALNYLLDMDAGATVSQSSAVSLPCTA